MAEERAKSASALGGTLEADEFWTLVQKTAPKGTARNWNTVLKLDAMLND